jgi:hypothetical protein
MKRQAAKDLRKLERCSMKLNRRSRPVFSLDFCAMLKDCRVGYEQLQMYPLLGSRQVSPAHPVPGHRDSRPMLTVIDLEDDSIVSQASRKVASRQIVVYLEYQFKDDRPGTGPPVIEARLRTDATR